MDAKVDRKKDIKTGSADIRQDEYRENVRRMMQDEVRNIIDDEMRKAIQELLEEQRNAIKLISNEQKAVIRQIVEEEKKLIWERSEMLAQSSLKLDHNFVENARK
jgi:hypothetical protein